MLIGSSPWEGEGGDGERCVRERICREKKEGVSRGEEGYTKESERREDTDTGAREGCEKERQE